MCLYAPNYYKKFKCIADKCKNSCCIGWEIDVDRDSFNYYKTVNSDFGKNIISKIEIFPTPHFKLDKNGHCPFLMNSGLCEIITNLGEEGLCQICYDHPRFRNYFESRTEIGLGLCCESAAKLILEDRNSFSVFPLDKTNPLPVTENDLKVIKIRDEIISILNESDVKLNTKLETVLYKFGDGNILYTSTRFWYNVYSNLERLDESWDKYLKYLKNSPKILNDNSYSNKIENAFKNLAVYFIYRHIPDFMFEKTVECGVNFCILSVLIIKSIYDISQKNAEHNNFNNLCEIARMYSSEIEYSEENIQKIIKNFDIL